MCVWLGAISYCDDLILLADSAAELQAMLNVCEQFARERFLLFNTAKSSATVVCASGARIQRSMNVFLCGDLIPLVERFKHLGFMYGWRSNADVHVEERIARFRGAVRSTASIPGLGCASLSLLRRLFEACAVPVLLYGLESVRKSDMSAKQFKLLNSAWNNAVRGVAGVCGRSRVVATHGLAGIEPLMLKWSRQKASFCSRLLRSESPAGVLFRCAGGVPGTLAHGLLSECADAFDVRDVEKCREFLVTPPCAISLSKALGDVFFSRDDRLAEWSAGLLAVDLISSTCEDDLAEVRRILYHAEYLKACAVK